MPKRIRRRTFLKIAGAATAALAVPGALSLYRQAAMAQSAEDRKLLFVVSAYGGASIVDSFLPVAASDNSQPDTHVVYPQDVLYQPDGSNLRCVSFTGGQDAMSQLLASHHQDMAVVTQECTSVNHIVAQKRAITGAGINGGRTLMEAAAARHGDGLLLPNCNMSSGGYIEPGDDDSLSIEARSEIIAQPLFFAPSTHGYQGLSNTPSADLIARARGVREQLDDASHFGLTFEGAERRQRFLSRRRDVLPDLEEAQLITNLLLFKEANLPLSEYGLESSPELARLEQHFPALAGDTFEAGAALAFLLARYGLSCSIAFGPNTGLEGDNTPLAFDFSHSDHLASQNQMWNRVCRVVDGLVTLLKQQDYLDDPSLGKMWDRSVIYIATDFGRDKIRPAGGELQWSSGHHLNNGNLLLSPLLSGNAVYGGVNPETLLTYGFNRNTGDPDESTLMREGDLYSLVAQALDIDFTERTDMSAALA